MARLRIHALLTGAMALVIASGCAGASGDGTVLAPTTAASIARSSSPSKSALASGGLATEPLDFERGGSHYVGGVSSGLVPASPDRVLAAVFDAGALSAMLPRTKRASLIEAKGATRRIELSQGNRFVNATYTVEMSRTGAPGEVRFHLDRSRRHDIDDVYGYLKVERFDAHRSSVTIAAAVDIGSNFSTMLFGKKVQDVILSTPHVMRAYFSRTGASAGPGLVAQADR